MDGVEADSGGEGADEGECEFGGDEEDEKGGSGGSGAAVSAADADEGEQ